MPLPAPFVLQCQEPTAPQGMACSVTPIYGAPRGTLGRFTAAVGGIVIHGIKDSYEGYLAKACQGGKIPINCHASMHYVIDADTGAVSSLVDEANVAWAFQSYRGNYPVKTPLNCCQCPTPCPTGPCPDDLCVPVDYVGWTVLPALYPNLSADFYTINIGITIPSRPEQTGLDGVACCGPYGISQVAYDTLVRLVAWIESRYPAITLDDEHIIFHDMLVDTDEQCYEFLCGPNGVCFICDVGKYCEKCQNVPDPTISTITDPADLLYIYGISTGGCQVRILFTDLFPEG